MKREEAIKDLDIIRFNPHWDELVNEEYWQELMEMAIKALEEVQQYRAIGTVEELIRGKRYMNIAKHHGTIGQVIDECVAYEAIGTPEECRKSVDICKAMAERRISLENMENYMKFEDECVKRGFTFNSLLKAREKQIAKRAMHQGCYDKNGEWHEWNGINGKPYELCPSCKVNLCCETSLDIKPKYCKNCGQKLDWRNEE